MNITVLGAGAWGNRYCHSSGKAAFGHALGPQ